MVSVITAARATPTDPDTIETRVTRQRDALLKLTTEQPLDCDLVPKALAQITEVAAATLRVSRVSIWRYNAGRTAIDCIDLYDAIAKEHRSGSSLRASDFPHYFRVIADSDVVAVDDAIADVRTSEFTSSYLRPLGIASMMDVAIRLGEAVIGVLCHEQTGPRRHWTDDEKAFAIGTSTLISLALERCERRRVESTLRLQSAAFNAAADATVITDGEGVIEWVNPAFTKLTGYSADEAIGRNPRDLLKSGHHDSAFYERMWSTLTSGQVWRGQVVNRRKDGTTYYEDQTITPIALNGSVTHFVAIKRDLTERHNLEEQFLQAQKMEVVGRLAGGIAHDFNNLLTVINGTAELALTDLAHSHPLHKDFQNIFDAGQRASNLTRQLLAFSRKQIVNRAPLEVGPVLTGFRAVLQRLIGEDIDLDIVADAGTVLADRGQFEQVILNLAVNARDAMPRGGKLIVEGSNVELDPLFAARHNGVRPGPHVKILVRDTGHGMTDQVMQRIFEPFFTTKEVGKGTGLGLSTVYAIVAQSGGTIWVDSAAGRGTLFTIYLPRVTEIAVAPAPDVEAKALAAGHTLLLVEDDDSVREVAVRIFRSAGYLTLAARDASEALHILAVHTEPISLIVTDVVLVGMGGRDLASNALKIRPGIPILFTSGHTDDLVLAHGVRENVVHFLSKPYTAASLTAKVRDVLNACESAS
jgi:two-component system cell cycle sensor histidine kinase/response regulator CckA